MRQLVKSVAGVFLLFRRTPRVFGGLPLDFLLALSAPILVEVFPMNGICRLILLLILALIFAEMACRLPVSRSWKIVAAILAFAATVGVGSRRVEEQFYVDGVISQYEKQRDLAEKYASRDSDLRRIVSHYDNMKESQSIFDLIGGKKRQPSVRPHRHKIYSEREGISR